MPQPHLKGLEPVMYLLLALVLLPLVEIALFILVGGWIGVWPTLGLIVLSALAGMAIVRRQGQGALNDMRRRLETLGDPSAPMAHGAMIMMAGFLLMLPDSSPMPWVSCCSFRRSGASFSERRRVASRCAPMGCARQGIPAVRMSTIPEMSSSTPNSKRFPPARIPRMVIPAGRGIEAGSAT